MDIRRESDHFYSYFRMNHVILYVGQGISDGQISSFISKCPWSCVITSRRDPEFATYFVKDNRTPREYTERAEIPTKNLSRKSLPILRLFGVEGDHNEDDLAWLRIEDDTQKEYDMDHAKDMLKLLPGLLDHVNPLVVTGINSDIDWKVFGDALNSILYYVTNGTVSFWGMPESVSGHYNQQALRILKKAIEKKNFLSYEAELSDVIHVREEETETIESDDYSGSENDIYYQGHHAITITQSELLPFKSVGLLLTEKTINKIHPIGRVMSRKWFANFLEFSSSLGPQWYGYLPQSDFHVKRSYEDALVELVFKLLDGRDAMGMPVDNRPIVLCGAPGSSKSITLAALAYRVFVKKINPVIYISKDSFLGINSGVSLDDLDDVMQYLEKKSEVDTRILIIWDSSTYKAGIERARVLLSRLRNKGRRFVLVCSSYNIIAQQDIEDGGYTFVQETGLFERCIDDSAQVFENDDCFFVIAKREMNQQEVEEFWKHASEYSGINNSTLSQLRDRFAEESRTEIFDYYYLLISVLRENLEQSLKSEQSVVFPYVEKEIKRAIGEIHGYNKENIQLSPMYQALKAAGLNVEEYIQQNDMVVMDEEEESLVIEKQMDDLNICIALFSRFKLSVPYGLAYTILLGEEDTDQYSERTRKLFQVLTNEIPWLFFAEDEEGNFSFRFRNSLEADIFLRNHDFSGEKQVDLLTHIIDIYGQDYRRSQCKDEVFTENLQALLRLEGPNSDYPAFRTTQKYEHNNILSRLNILIDKLKELREIYGVPDEDASFASIIITFTREYYGSIWDGLASIEGSDADPWLTHDTSFTPEDYIIRIERLISAITLAERSIEDLENSIHSKSMTIQEVSHCVSQKNTLAVEIAQCNMRLEDLIDKYGKCCSYYGIEERDYSLNRLNYRELYRLLMSVIIKEPTNGYAYNTLFRSFRRVYERRGLNNSYRLQYLSEIMQVVETCETFDSQITSRGGHGYDELTNHVNNIKDYSADFKITLDSILRHRKGIAPQDDEERLCFDLYDEMLEANNAAAITFVCQKELRLPKGTRKLSSEQIDRCQKVYNFMMEDDNYKCVSENAYALLMLIRVAWMVFNREVLSSLYECQLTHMTDLQWQEIYRLSRQYEGIAGDNKNPLIILIYALSALQINDLQERGYKEAFDILDSINEAMFFQRRLWTPFMVCNKEGQPYEFSGTVISTKNYSGFIRIYGVPQRANGSNGVRFRQFNLGRTHKMPMAKDVLSHLELGIGYTGFSAYTEEGRKERGVE